MGFAFYKLLTNLIPGHSLEIAGMDLDAIIHCRCLYLIKLAFKSWGSDRILTRWDRC